jgi:hypothetical protein
MKFFNEEAFILTFQCFYEEEKCLTPSLVLLLITLWSMLLLTKHLRDINERYLCHFKHAMYFAFHCFCSSIALVIHSIFPFLFVTTGSNTIKKLFYLMMNRVKKLEMLTSGTKRIAIIGYGASGTITLYNIVKSFDGALPLEISIFDKSPLHKGTAYLTKNINHLLNVRAKHMSAIAQDSLHLVNWL